MSHFSRIISVLRKAATPLHSSHYMTTLAYLSMDRWGRGCIATYAAGLTVMHARQKRLVRANGMPATAMQSASCFWKCSLILHLAANLCSSRAVAPAILQHGFTTPYVLLSSLCVIWDETLFEFSWCFYLSRFPQPPAWDASLVCGFII